MQSIIYFYYEKPKIYIESIHPSVKKYSQNEKIKSHRPKKWARENTKEIYGIPESGGCGTVRKNVEKRISAFCG